MANVGNPAGGYYPDRTANVGYVKDLFVKWTSGATGAVATLLPFAEVASVTRTNTGAFTIQFTQAYNGTRNMYGDIAQATYSKTGACQVVHVSDANEATNGTLKILTVDAAGDATDPTTGDVVHITFQVATATGYP
jgi:hypothetical protein